MFKTKRKRAVVLALIAFFCTAATTYVAVDWKRLGGGFLAYFKGKSSQAVASGGGSSSGTRVARTPTIGDSRPAPATLPRLAAADMPRHGSTGSTGGGSGGHKSDDDLFKYGDPAAGGIPPGSFIVAQNDTPGGNANNGGAPAPVNGGGPAAPEGAAPAPAGGGEGGGSGGGVGSPAPSPTGSIGGSGDSGIVVGKTPTPAPPAATPPAATPPAATPPAATPPAATPPAPAPTPPVASPPADTPAPAPSQSGTTSDPGTGDGDGDPSGGSTTPISSPPPVTAVPEASNLAMMSLGALFLAVAATRKRKNG